MIKDLKRYPILVKDPLQAFDSADELILGKLGSQGKRVLVLNDGFGALASELIDRELTSYTDSFVAAKAAQLNTHGKIICLNDLEKLKGPFDTVLIKIPKSSSFFEDQLCHIGRCITAETRIICGSMVKHLSKSSFDLLEKYIGPTTTSLAKKKARLIFAKFDRAQVDSPWPQKIKLDGFSNEFIHHSNVFSRERLDIGARFFLEHIPKGTFKSILDLGCGNGVVGVRAHELNPTAQIIFSDDSAMAIKSARSNFPHNGEFHWTNCYEDGAPNSLDLVLCNPPFHQQHTVGDFIAWQMFLDAKKVLRTGAQLRVIGNSHLGYQQKLKKIFGNSRIVATNDKFMIVDAFK